MLYPVPPHIEEQLLHLLDQAIAKDGAQLGNIQYFDKADKTLYIIAQRGFAADFIKHFYAVKPFDSSACGRAWGTGNIITIDDTTTDIGYKPHRKIAAAAGYRAVKSVPVLNADKNPVGLVSTHFVQPKHQWDPKSLGGLPAKIAKVLQAVHPVGVLQRSGKEAGR